MWLNHVRYQRFFTLYRGIYKSFKDKFPLLAGL